MSGPVQLRLSSYVAASPPVTIDGGDPGRVVIATRTGALIRVSETLWQALQRGQLDAVSSAHQAALVEIAMLVRADADELSEILASNAAAIATNPTLEQVIQPTAACQLGCGYCGQEHRPLAMDDRTQAEVVAGIGHRLKDAVRRGRPYSQLHVGWFGAEPLLGLEVMRLLTPRLRQLALEADAAYAAHVVTNGLRLTPAVARELAGRFDVTQVEVTLDGPPKRHDMRRHTKSGRPTFDRIWNNLLGIASEKCADFVLVLRCNVDRTNADDVPELIDLIGRSSLQHRARLYFSPVYDWGNDAKAAALSPEDFAEREVAWMAQQLSLDMPVDLVPGRREIVCVAVQPDARVVDAEGNQFTCTEAPLVPAYGKPNRYQVDVGLHIRRKDASAAASLPFQGFNEVIASNEVGCSRCPMLPVCGGACPKAWQDGAAPCPSFKRNMPDRLLLEVAQARTLHSAHG